MGILSAALRQSQLTTEEYATLREITTQLNRTGAQLPLISGVHALTDVTGFGLLGHVAELCQASSVSADVSFAQLPILPAAVRYAQAGMVTGASARNLAHVQAMLSADLAPWQMNLLTDPQTSGGLLVSCTLQAVKAVQAAFQTHGQQAVRIGRLTAGSAPHIHVTDSLP